VHQDARCGGVNSHRPQCEETLGMSDDLAKRDELQAAYKAAVDERVARIRADEALASVPHPVAEVDTWEAACVVAEGARLKAEAAKVDYEA
jgi:hypothetical protein